MAANPLPRPRTTAADFTVNAATVTGDIPGTGSATPGQTIEWTNPTGPDVQITTDPIAAKYPLIPSHFTVNTGLTEITTVASVPADSYGFNRNGAGVGHIIVGGGGMPKPTRAK